MPARDHRMNACRAAANRRRKECGGVRSRLVGSRRERTHKEIMEEVILALREKPHVATIAEIANRAGYAVRTLSTCTSPTCPSCRSQGATAQSSPASPCRSATESMPTHDSYSLPGRGPGAQL